MKDALVDGAVAKKTGHDAIVIVGRASEPSVLVIDDSRVELQPAADLVGQTCGETEQLLKVLTSRCSGQLLR
jgi:aldehyde:ferredoxin oxidoreductase